jgi:hypothetical protein
MRNRGVAEIIYRGFELQMATNAGASFINIFIDVPNQKKRRL